MGKILDSSGEPFEKEPGNSLLSTDLWVSEIKKLWGQNMAWERMQRVMELRKLCGVEVKTTTINVRKPPRYTK